MSGNFVHLHTHSEYSLLDGLGRIKNLVYEAKKLGQSAMALTDHGVMHGAIEFFRAAKSADIKPIIGVEAYQTAWGRPMDGRDSKLDRENHHLLLLARNMVGYRNLLKICSNSHLNGYYYRPRIDHDFLAAHAEGLIATTGCLGAEVPQLLSQGKEQEAYDRLGWYVEVFGKENFFIELQEHTVPDLIPVNKVLVPWAEKFGIGLVATNDVHYVREQDGNPHDVLLCVQTGTTVQATDRMRMSDGSYFLKSRAQMEDTFRPLIDLPASAFDNTVLVADMCDVDLEDESYHLPDLPIPDGFTYETYMRHLTEEGLVRLYGERASTPEVQERKERELTIIHQMGFDIYFLIVADLCNFARSRNIWWNVRGSGAGSLVAYCVGITGIDPLKNNLIFERFLNPGRVSMPDFDMDFPDDQREEMIRYTLEKFGEEKVAQIATFGRMKARAAVRDVGRAKGIELSQVDRISKLIPAIPGKPVTIQDVLTEGHEFYNPDLVHYYEKEPWARDLLDTSMQLEGVARHSSVHAAAVIIADRELTHYTPLMRGNKNTVTSTITQYEFPILESIGLLKVDFLGLSTLSVMREAARLIRERHDIEYNLSNIPIEGEESAEAFKLLSSGEVSGVFQVEGQGMRRVLTEMRPTTFEHIVATISLYRPGPIEYIPSFIKRMHGEEKVEFKHSSLENILGETYGICVSGDSIVMDTRTGERRRLDELKDVDDFYIQGVDADWKPAVGRVTHWIDSGYKEVYQVSLRNGASIKVTGDHRLLTETGWQPLNQLTVGDHIGAPPVLLGPDEDAVETIDRRKLRVLAYLLADGSLGNIAAIDFVSKEPALLDEYVRCLEAFPDARPVFTPQVRGVTRISVAKQVGLDAHYHAPTSLLAWLRELGVKHPAGSRPGGLRSHEKFVPAFVFNLSQENIAYFLASLWDGDGYIGRKLCHYRTISKQLAEDVQTLLLRLGIRSTTYTSSYRRERGGETEQRVSYQLTIYDTARLAALIQPHMVSSKRDRPCTGQSHTTIARDAFLKEAKAVTALSSRSLMRQFGIDRQHFYPTGLKRQRISVHVVEQLSVALPMPSTNRKLNVDWQEIVSIEPVGVEHVYDLTVEGLHSFVANNIIVHNCVYQEQIIQILSQLAGYTPGDADLVRRAISKKKASDIEKHKKIFVEGCYQNGIPKDAASAIYGDIEFFARYGFNKSHAADYGVITVQTAYLKAHYPVEYMAALLLIERDKTEKVINFINECRRMGIDVLPPDVNYSGLDFDIQTRPADVESNARRDPNIAYKFPVPEDSAIRFGMAAVKNVGEGPVKVILAAREEGGPFHSLEEFCERVDLRQVNKRALECLIKVGAFDRFGLRSQLLDVLEQMMAQSASVFSARDSGQLSMFDLMSEAGATSVSPIVLPKIEEVKGRDKLLWEKELLGVYAVSHPLQAMSVDIRNIVTCGCSELDERYDGKNVFMAGMITTVRTINTKKGDQMAFVQIEDMGGQCEVVVFPRTYAEVKELLIPESIVVVKGKAQAREGQTSILADSFQTYVDQILSVGADNEYQAPLLDAPTINGFHLGGNNMENSNMDESSEIANMFTGFEGDDDAGAYLEESPFANEPPAWYPPEAEGNPVSTPFNQAKLNQPKQSAASSMPDEAAPDNPYQHESRNLREDESNYEIPLPKSLQNNPSFAQAQTEDTPEEVASPTSPVGSTTGGVVKDGDGDKTKKQISALDKVNGDVNGEAYSNGTHHANGTSNGHSNGQNNGHTQEQNGQNSLIANGKRTMQIVFRPSGDTDRDKYRLKQIVDTVRNPKGRDQFMIVIKSHKSTTLAFPDDPCSINDRLCHELNKFFRVEVQVKESGE